MSTSDALNGEGTTITKLLKTIRELRLESFRQSYGDVFLLQTGHASDMKPPDRPWRSTVAGSLSFKNKNEGGVNKDSLVYPIRNTERTLTSRFVSVGRNADTNDIIINDESISGAHAVFEKLSSGGYVIRDLGSRNGTFVNKESVPKHQSLDVSVGDTVQLGAVTLTFIDVFALTAFSRYMKL